MSKRRILEALTKQVLTYGEGTRLWRANYNPMENLTQSMRQDAGLDPIMNQPVDKPINVLPNRHLRLRF